MVCPRGWQLRLSTARIGPGSYPSLALAGLRFRQILDHQRLLLRAERRPIAHHDLHCTTPVLKTPVLRDASVQTVTVSAATWIRAQACCGLGVSVGGTSVAVGGSDAEGGCGVSVGATAVSVGALAY